MNKILLALLSAVAIVSLIAFVFYGFVFIETQAQMAENEARFQCAQSSKYEVTDGDAIVSYPVAQLYEKCLKEKGIQ